MKSIGARVIANSKGEIISILHDMYGDVLARPDATNIFAIDLPVGEIDGKIILGVNPITKEVLLEAPNNTVSTSEQRINTLEDELLLQAESNIGGIL